MSSPFAKYMDEKINLPALFGGEKKKFCRLFDIKKEKDLPA